MSILTFIFKMDTVQPSLRSAPRGKVHGRSQSGGERSASCHKGAPIRGSEENHVSPAIPKVFAFMLKTTTETGEEGLFAIKPSRVPHSPRKIGGAYRDSPLHKSKGAQPYVAAVIDDRRRLPSYARDTSSEVISMYETTSQKSANRAFNGPDYRSYSMTQTYSTYCLSNHRSYASLRSQPESTALQRPRSPFAYPSRLKRPGFRPSSPALTDGGAVDYSRRAEIDRLPHVSDACKFLPQQMLTIARVVTVWPRLRCLSMPKSDELLPYSVPMQIGPLLPC